MAFEEQAAPDVGRGFAIVAKNGGNRWRTDIRSVLCQSQPNGDDRVAYLTHECRAESVNPTSIFDGRLYEFTVVASWDGIWFLRHGSYNFGFGRQPPETTYEASKHAVSVSCPAVRIVPHTLDEVIQQFRGKAAKRYFLKVVYRFEGTAWTAYAPARYINFPARDRPGRYLQPISGYTLFHNGNRFVIAYVAAHIRRGSCSIEFLAREPVGFLDTKIKTGKVYKPGFCKSAPLDEVRKHGHVLTPGRYVGAEAQEDDGEPFEHKMKRLVAQLKEQQADAAKLDAAIAANLRGLGYG